MERRTGGVRFVHVRGHSSDNGNDRADALVQWGKRGSDQGQQVAEGVPLSRCCDGGGGEGDSRLEADGADSDRAIFEQQEAVRQKASADLRAMMPADPLDCLDWDEATSAHADMLEAASSEGVAEAALVQATLDAEVVARLRADRATVIPTPAATFRLPETPTARAVDWTDGEDVGGADRAGEPARAGGDRPPGAAAATPGRTTPTPPTSPTTENSTTTTAGHPSKRRRRGTLRQPTSPYRTNTCSLYHE